MAYLLNLVYLALLVVAVAVARLAGRAQGASIAQGFAEKFLGAVPLPQRRRAVRLAARRERGRGESARAAVGRDSPPPARLGMRHLGDQLTGFTLARKKYAELRSSTARWISVGPCAGHAAHPARLAWCWPSWNCGRT